MKDYAKHAAPAAGLVLIVLAYLWFVVRWFADVEVRTVRELLMARGLYLWSATSVVVLAAVLWSGALTVGAIRTLTAERSSNRALWRSITVAALILGALAAWKGGGGEGTDRLIQELTEPVRSRVEWALRINNFLAAGYIVLLFFAVAILARASDAAASGKALLQLFRIYSLLLWSASILLVIAVVEIFVLWEWPASLMNEKLVLAASRLAHALPAAAGLVFSALLAALFIPVAMAQSRQLDRLWDQAKAKDKELKREDWLEEVGFADATPMRAFASHAAMLAPLVGGMLASFIGFPFKT